MEKLISYAQNFEDIMLWRALSHVQHGCYIDVGAQSPDIDSVSRLFHEHGWRGVHVEPTLHYANQLRARRPEEVVLQLAVSDKPGILRFFEVAESGLSTMEQALADEHREAGFEVSEIRVPAVTLDAVLEQAAHADIHWLKIDVEGAEARVVDGWRESAARPWIVVVESTRPCSTVQTHLEWEPMLLAKGYEFAYFDGLNRFYVSAEHKELIASFECGPNVFDDFSLSAASVFCAEVNLAYRALEVHNEGQIAAKDAEIAARDAEIAARDLEIAARDELVVQARQEAQGEADELAKAHAEHARKQAEHVLVINAMVQAQHRTLSEHQRMIDAATAESRADADSSRKELGKQQIEANRWWKEAERLRSQLHEMEISRSWQLTRPLRALRRRSSAGVIVNVKMLLRPVATASLRMAIAVPGVRRVLKPLLSRVPFIYNRLHVIAQNERMFDAIRPLPIAIGGPEREVSATMMDKKTAQVLEDLRVACGQGVTP